MPDWRAIRAFLFDMDGTIYLGSQLIPGVLECLDLLRSQGKRFLFVTNNSSVSALGYVRKLQRLGISATQDEILTSGNAAAVYLKTLGVQRLFVLGTPEFEQELRDDGFCLTPDQPDCVLLGFDKTLTYQKLETACLLIRAGVRFVATHPDPVCPMDYGSIPDCGAMSALLETATGVAPIVVGKPHALMVEMALKRLGIEADEAAMVGDRLFTDIRMGVDAGLATGLVLSGEATRQDVAVSPIKPDVILETVAELAMLVTGQDG